MKYLHLILFIISFILFITFAFIGETNLIIINGFTMLMNLILHIRYEVKE